MNRAAALSRALGWVREAYPDGVPPEDRAGWMKANLPTLPRLLWALLGKRQYAGYRRRVYGDAAAA